MKGGWKGFEFGAVLEYFLTHQHFQMLRRYKY